MTEGKISLNPGLGGVKDVVSSINSDVKHEIMLKKDEDRGPSSRQNYVFLQ